MKFTKIYIIAPLFFYCAGIYSINAQDIPKKIEPRIIEHSIEENIRIADKLFAHGMFHEAADHYAKVIDADTLAELENTNPINYHCYYQC